MDTVAIKKVYDELRTSLDIPKETPIERYSVIGDLTAGGLEPVELLGILHNLGINPGDYCQGERLNQRGFNMLLGIVLEEGVQEDCDRLGKMFVRSLPNCPIISVQDLANYMRPAYLERIVTCDGILRKLKAA